MQYGFTKVIGCDKLENAQCTLCNTILGNDSLKPSKLKRHKELKHKENMDLVEMFKAKRAGSDDFWVPTSGSPPCWWWGYQSLKTGSKWAAIFPLA